MNFLKRLRLAAFLLVAAGLFASQSQGAPPLDPAGLRLIEQLAGFYQALSEFTVHSTYSMQTGGTGAAQKRAGTIAIRKPDHFAASIKFGAKTTGLRSDGKNFLIHELPQNTYTQAPAPPELAPVLQEIAPGLNDLIAPDPKASLLEGVQKLEVIGGDVAGGEACRRIRFTQATGTVDLWIEVGQKPLVRKIVMKVNEPAGTLLEMQFDDWNLAPKFDAKTFDLTPPAGATKADPGA